MKVVRRKSNHLAELIFEDHAVCEFVSGVLKVEGKSYLWIKPEECEVLAGVSAPDLWVSGALAFDGVWSVVDQPAYDDGVDQYKERLKKQVTDYRYQLEINHPFLDSSRESRTLLFGVEADAKADPNHIEDFKNSDGVWVSMTAPEIIAMTKAVRAWVRSCFRREMEIHKALDQASTPAEIFAVDRFSNWPTGEV